MSNYFCNSRLIACCCLLVCVVGSARASNPSRTITGHVMDPDGRAVAGASLRLDCTAARVQFQVATDASGKFSIQGLPAESCGVTVRRTGFEDQVYPDISLLPGAPLDISLTLQLAVVKEVVNVQRERTTTTDNLTVSEVRESPAKDVGEALAQMDGIWKVRKGGIANDIVLRGFQHGNIDVLIDGARIYGACPSSMDPSTYHIDFAEVEQIGVTKGPFDLKHEGGLGGTVEIVNKRPTEGLTIRPTISAGSSGFINPGLTTSIGTETFKVLGGYSYRTAQPYTDGLGKSFMAYANYKPAATNARAFDIHTGWFVFDFSPGINHTISLGYTRQQGGLVLYPYLLMDANYDNADRINFKYEVRNPISRVAAIRVQSYITRVKHFMTDAIRSSSLMAQTDSPFSMATHAATLAAGGHVEAELRGGFSAGFEMFQRNWKATNYMRTRAMNMDQAVIPDVGALASGAYVEWRRGIRERAQLSGGVRVDHMAMSTAAQAGTDLYYAYKGTRRTSAFDTAPSANFRLTVTAFKSLDVFLGMGTAVRFPDAQERYFQQRKMGLDVVGNPSLSPTRNTGPTIGVRYQRGSSYFRTEMFYNALNGFITVQNQARVQAVPTVMNTRARSFEQVNARIYGGESSYALALPHNLLVSGGASYTRGIQDHRPQAGMFSSNMAEMPPLRGWTSIRYTHRLFFTELGGIAVNRQDRVNLDLNERATAGYGLMNLQLGVHPGKLYLTMFLNNVLNRYYFEHFSAQRDPFQAGVKIPEPGRNVFVTVSYSF